MIVVDTNVWSEATKALPSSKVRSWAERNQARLRLSAIVLAELRGGASLMPGGQRRRALEAQIEGIASLHADVILPFDEAASRAYAKVLETARRTGKPILTADAMIAATALANGMQVATRDIAGFSGAGVALIDPWED